MIRVDAGNDLYELLARAGQLADRGRLDVAVPFIDADSALWQRLLSAARSGSRVRLLTRPAAGQLHSEPFGDLARCGVRIVPMPRLHAKSVLLSDRRGHSSMGWIGSHNFTKASEGTAQELGIAFWGCGLLEARLLQQALIQLDAWEHEARANCRLR